MGALVRNEETEKKNNDYNFIQANRIKLWLHQKVQMSNDDFSLLYFSTPKKLKVIQWKVQRNIVGRRFKSSTSLKRHKMKEKKEIKKEELVCECKLFFISIFLLACHFLHHLSIDSQHFKLQLWMGNFKTIFEWSPLQPHYKRRNCTHQHIQSTNFMNASSLLKNSFTHSKRFRKRKKYLMVKTKLCLFVWGTNRKK